MSNIIAGVICGQIPYLDEHIAQKKVIYERYNKGKKDLLVKMIHLIRRRVNLTSGGLV